MSAELPKEDDHKTSEKNRSLSKLQLVALSVGLTVVVMIGGAMISGIWRPWVTDTDKNGGEQTVKPGFPPTGRVIPPEPGTSNDQNDASSDDDESDENSEEKEEDDVAANEEETDKDNPAKVAASNTIKEKLEALHEDAKRRLNLNSEAEARLVEAQNALKNSEESLRKGERNWNAAWKSTKESFKPHSKNYGTDETEQKILEALAAERAKRKAYGPLAEQREVARMEVRVARMVVRETRIEKDDDEDDSSPPLKESIEKNADAIEKLENRVSVLEEKQSDIRAKLASLSSMKVPTESNAKKLAALANQVEALMRAFDLKTINGEEIKKLLKRFDAIDTILKQVVLKDDLKGMYCIVRSGGCWVQKSIL